MKKYSEHKEYLQRNNPSQSEHVRKGNAVGRFAGFHIDLIISKHTHYYCTYNSKGENREGRIDHMTARRVSHDRCHGNAILSVTVVLVKLRLNVPLQDLAFRFGVFLSTLSRTFTAWLTVMGEVFHKAKQFVH